MSLKRKGTLLFTAAAAASVFVGAAAFACTNLATLNLSSTAGKPGDVVTVTGSSFAVGRGDAPTFPVQLRWNGVDGPVLAEAVPDRSGNISATFTVPEGTPGYYVLVATQRNAQGVDTYGTPARASYQILGANPQPAVAPPPAATASAAPSEGSSAGIIALTVGLGALGLVLFGAGFVAFVRQTRRATSATAAPARQS